ncbi:hypothetical protein ES703_64305 [subsurface metagenome]
MKIGIYAPYLAVYGGGEKYIGKIAEILSRENDVAFVVFTKPDFEKLGSRLNIDLSRVAIDNIRSPASPLNSRIAILRTFIHLVNAHKVSKYTKECDLFINQEYLSSIPSLAKTSFLICQIPPTRWNRLSRLTNNPFTNQIYDPKVKSYDKIIVYSFFTKKWAEKYYDREVEVMYPAVDTESFVSSSKENIILSVGRFGTALHCKKQLDMVKAFKELCTQHELINWEYHLVGGLGGSPTDHKYLADCRKEAKHYPIFFYVNAPFEKVKELYGKAKFFWHAAGLGEDENEHPERMEHFGMATVEAMSAGCVPIVIKKGGQPEIVRDKIDGFLFETVEELNECTLRLINDSALWRKMSEACIRRSQEFSFEKFERRVMEVFQF